MDQDKEILIALKKGQTHLSNIIQMVENKEYVSSIWGTCQISIESNGKKYQPIYIGKAEAEMMQEQKLFQKIGDKIDNLFGNDVIVAGILPKTETMLDNMHFVGADFEIRK